jgi:metal-responsive CopG/Arc/MetJ family transcriptional regulator
MRSKTYKVVGISLPESLIAKIDEDRGLVNRSRWIQHLLEKQQHQQQEQQQQLVTTTTVTKNTRRK